MEMEFLRREIPVFLAEALPGARTTLSAESVVPDALPDVGRILATRGRTLLKGKEPTARGLTVSGEASAAVLYLSEDGSRLGTLQIDRPFQMDLEAPAPEESALPQVRLQLLGAEARIVNPRRLAVDFALCAEGEAYRKSSLTVEEAPPEGAPPGLHFLEQESAAWALTGVGEKSFALREQFAFPAEQPAPADLVTEEVGFRTLDCRQIGDRVVLKGELQLAVWGIGERGELTRAEFTAPFSQLLNAGQGSAEQFRLWIEPCQTWMELIKSPDGAVTLDAEIHAAAQLCAWSRVQIRSVADAYSNACPWEAGTEEQELVCRQSREKAPLGADARLDLPEDLEEPIALLPLLGSVEHDGSRAGLSLDLLYRNRDGELAAARRSLELTGEKLPESARIEGARLLSCRLGREGERTALQAAAELEWAEQTCGVLRRVTKLSLQEGEAVPVGPDLVLAVRRGESLWELAKEYGSSVELMESCGGGEDEALLLIPRERV